MGSKSKKSEKENGIVIATDNVESEEQIALKRAEKKAKKQAKRNKEAAAEVDSLKKSKKRKSHDEEETDVKPEKKHKKSQKIAAAPVATETTEERSKDSEEVNSEDERAARKEKKSLKKEKKEKKAAAALKNGQDAKAKEDISQNPKHKSSKTARQPEPAAKPVASADQWNPDALTGDAARKNKFLRLLGAGKGGAIEAAPTKKQASDKDIQRVESELERQFAAGIRMKHGGMGKRTGLGM